MYEPFMDAWTYGYGRMDVTDVWTCATYGLNFSCELLLRRHHLTELIRTHPSIHPSTHPCVPSKRTPTVRRKAVTYTTPRVRIFSAWKVLFFTYFCVRRRSTLHLITFINIHLQSIYNPIYNPIYNAIDNHHQQASAFIWKSSFKSSPIPPLSTMQSSTIHRGSPSSLTFVSPHECTFQTRNAINFTFLPSLINVV